MKKNRKWCLPLVFTVLIGACTADAYNVTSKSSKEEEDNKPLSETWSAVPENYNCLNVVYYVPADMDTLMLWHKRLSGMTLNTQKFFKDNMQLHKFDKTFGLVVNDSNQNYIQMTYIKSNLEASKMNQKNMLVMANEVMDYFKANPDKKSSNHFLVYTPEYTGAFFDCAYLDPTGSGMLDHTMAFAGCDTEKFDPKFLKSTKGREKYLNKTGRVMYELMHAFLQDDNSGSGLLTRFSLTGKTGDYGTPVNYEWYCKDMDKINLTPLDAMWLNRIQVFNEVGYDYVPLKEVVIEDVKFSWIDDEEYFAYRDSLLVECTFRSSDDLAGAVVYIDPWRSSIDAEHQNPNARNTANSMSYVKNDVEFVKVGNSYKVNFLVLWSEMNTKNKAQLNGLKDPNLPAKDDPDTQIIETNEICKAEMRFRFIGKSGMAYPQPGVSLKGDWGSKFRWPFQMRRYKLSSSSALDCNYPDVVERYQK